MAPNSPRDVFLTTKKTRIFYHEDHEDHEDNILKNLRVLRDLRGKNPGLLRGLNLLSKNGG